MTQPVTSILCPVDFSSTSEEAARYAVSLAQSVGASRITFLHVFQPPIYPLPEAAGLIGAIELQPIAGNPTKRAFSAFVRAYEKGVLIRTTGDIIALSPPLIITKGQIDELIDHVREVLNEVD